LDTFEGSRQGTSFLNPAPPFAYPAFRVTLLGFKPAGHVDLPTAHIEALRFGDCLLKLTLFLEVERRPTPRQADPLAFYITLRVSALDQTVGRCQAIGTTLLVPVTSFRTTELRTVRFAFVSDPMGNRIELVEGNAWSDSLPQGPPQRESTPTTVGPLCIQPGEMSSSEFGRVQKMSERSAILTPTRPSLFHAKGAKCRIDVRRLFSQSRGWVSDVREFMRRRIHETWRQEKTGQGLRFRLSLPEHPLIWLARIPPMMLSFCALRIS
jgi:hypothetical protein